jgi:integrase
MATTQERKTKSGNISYTAIVRLKGYPTQTATFDKKSDAKDWIQETEVSIKQGRHSKTKDFNKHTLSELIDRYIQYELPQRKSDHQKFAMQLNWWKKNIGAYYLSDTTPALLSEYRDILQNENNKSNATVNRYMAALSVVFSIAARDWEWIEQNPMIKVRKKKESSGRVRYLTDEERESLLKACKESTNPYLYPVVILAIATGA